MTSKCNRWLGFAVLCSLAAFASCYVGGPDSGDAMLNEPDASSPDSPTTGSDADPDEPPDGRPSSTTDAPEGSTSDGDGDGDDTGTEPGGEAHEGVLPGYFELRYADGVDFEIDLGGTILVPLLAIPAEGYRGTATVLGESDVALAIRFSDAQSAALTSLEFVSDDPIEFFAELESPLMTSGRSLTVPRPETGHTQLALSVEEGSAEIDVPTRVGPVFEYVLNSVSGETEAIYRHDEITVKTGTVMFVVNPAATAHGLHGMDVIPHMLPQHLSMFRDGMAWNPGLNELFAPGEARDIALADGAFDQPGTGVTYCHDHQGFGDHEDVKVAFVVEE